MLKKMMILVASLSLSACVEYQQPKSWILREDAILRRVRSDEECKEVGLPNGCKEELSVREYIDFVKRTENHSIGIVVTPAGAEALTNAIKSCNYELEQCKQGH